MKKSRLLAVLLIMVLTLVGCGGFSDGLKDGMNDAMNGKPEITENTEEVKEEVTEEIVVETKEQEAAEVQGQKEPETAVQETKEEEKPEEEPETAEQSTESANVLLTAPVTVKEVMNGTKTEVIGEWAQIVVAKELATETSMEEFAEFCNTAVKDSGYNWYTISFGDGTGIQFQGSVSYVATYGTIDNDGCIEKAIGTIMLQGDGTYSYTEN